MKPMRVWASAAAATIGALFVAPMVVAPTPAVAAPAHPRVVVIGTDSVRWTDIDGVHTPNLWRLLGNSALGSLSVKAADPVSCPDDGWLTLGAGNRATAQDRSRGECHASGLVVRPGQASEPGSAYGTADVAGFGALYDTNVHRTDETHLGALADAMRASGQCVAAAGAEAALGAADSRGHVAVYSADPGRAASDPGFLDRCPVTLVSASPSDLDHVVAMVMAHAPPNTAALVMGISEIGAASSTHLHVAIAHGARFGDGLLVSASTRRPPFVQLVDVAPTVLSLRGLDTPSSMIGQPWRGAPEPAALQAKVTELSRLDLAAQQQERAIVPFWVTVVVLMVVACALAWWLARRQTDAENPRHPSESGTPVPSQRRARWAALACAWCALLPASSFLIGMVSWWASPIPLLVLALATLGAASVATRLAVALEVTVWRRRPFGLAAAVGTITFLVIALDLVTGANLQIFTPAGYSPLVAGRFAGIGNVGFGIFAAGALICAGGVVDAVNGRGAVTAGGWQSPRSWRSLPSWRSWRSLPSPRSPGVLVAVIGVVAVAVDGAPPWGSDVGGVLALVPAFAVLAWLLAGSRVSWRRALAGAVLAVAVIVVLGVIDYARPAGDQTHLGRFVGDVLHGGAWSIVRRKALADLQLLGSSVLTLLIPLMVIVAIWVVHAPRPPLRRAFDRVPVLRPTLISLLVMAVVGAVVNDSGIAIPALAVLVVLPATMTAVVANDQHCAPVGAASVAPPELLR